MTRPVVRVNRKKKRFIDILQRDSALEHSWNNDLFLFYFIGSEKSLTRVYVGSVLFIVMNIILLTIDRVIDFVMHFQTMVTEI